MTQMLAIAKPFEIHFVREGKKKVMRVGVLTMSDICALKAVLMECGMCFGTLSTIHDRKTLIALTSSYGIKNVRWNKAIHTIPFVVRMERAKKRIDIYQI
ncbi:hypothetical protein ACF8GG_19755 [Pseudomonas sp. yb_1]|uniref:hypothetical protein n=1 Tax=Pseudomonas sp. yb_1 TaxID=3367217 RepID=UPI00370CDD7D